MDISDIKTDQTLENDGVWVDYQDGARFKIRSADCRQYRNFIAKETRKHNPQRLKRDPETMADISIRAIAATILLDWEGVTENGEPLPCTDENRLKLVRLKPIRDFLAEESQDIANFQTEARDEDAATFPGSDPVDS